MDFTQQALENLIAFTGDPEIENKTGAFLYYKQYWGWPTEIEGKPGHFRDDLESNGTEMEQIKRMTIVLSCTDLVFLCLSVRGLLWEWKTFFAV